MDTVAIVSIVASACVGIAGLITPLIAGAWQRRHERTLAFESRAWDRKVDGMFSVIGHCRSFLDLADASADSPVLVLAAERLHADLYELVPVVETFASTRCRVQYADFRRCLSRNGINILTLMRAEAAREEKEHAIDVKDFAGAAKARDREKELLEEVKRSSTLDTSEALRLAKEVIGAARASLRGED